ncbi:MAG: EVE domain-containing protein [Pseudomonadota bacterium]
MMTNESKKYWLIKSEPNVWSWDMQVAVGKKGECWSGVRNYQARNNLKAAKIGDLAFFYHSNEGKEIVGIVEVIKEAYPDPTHQIENSPWVAIDVKAIKSLKKSVSLATIKAEPMLADMVLVNNMRLSVQPVSEEEWRIICSISNS